MRSRRNRHRTAWSCLLYSETITGACVTSRTLAFCMSTVLIRTALDNRFYSTTAYDYFASADLIQVHSTNRFSCLVAFNEYEPLGQWIFPQSPWCILAEIPWRILHTPVWHTQCPPPCDPDPPACTYMYAVEHNIVQHTLCFFSAEDAELVESDLALDSCSNKTNI